MGLAVCTGAMLSCSFGAAPSPLMVLPANLALVSNMPMANIMDNKPMVNILSFGMCQSPSNPTVIAATAAAAGVFTPAPCLPLTVVPWTPGNPTVLLANMPVINDSSMLTCSWGGIIKISSPGQTTTMV